MPRIFFVLVFKKLSNDKENNDAQNQGSILMLKKLPIFRYFCANAQVSYSEGGGLVTRRLHIR